MPEEWRWELGPIKRVYLVGAGASVHYGLPTLKTLAWELVESLDSADRNILLMAIRESFGWEMTSAELSVDYEELLNRLNPDALRYLDLAGVGPPESPRRRAALLALQGLHDFVLDRCKRVADQRGPFDGLVRGLEENHPSPCIRPVSPEAIGVVHPHLLVSEDHVGDLVRHVEGGADHRNTLSGTSFHT